MFEHTFQSIINTKAFLEINHMDTLVSERINFLEGFEENPQFTLLESSEKHIIFRDLIRETDFEMRQDRPYDCGTYHYTIKELRRL
ncbi:MAG: hypothetical protein PHC62_00900 [Candidatus Izemoplasmatales bacterium]|nr:hypothetical protein [Candidatus Izemoplasmatales bacterium]